MKYGKATIILNIFCLTMSRIYDIVIALHKKGGVMNFKRYSSIENHNNQDFITNFKQHCSDDLEEQTFIITEKIDGANIQFMISADENERTIVCKRNSQLETYEDFFDIWNVIAGEPYNWLLQQLKRIAVHDNVNFRLFGELYGPLINKRINYGDEQKIKFFDVYINDVLQPQSVFFTMPAVFSRFLPENHLSKEFSYEDYLVKPLASIKGLTAALDYDIEGFYGEGVIIQPYTKVIRNFSGERFILKKKSQQFKDIEHKKIKDNSEQTQISILNEEFKLYITENRVLDTISKHGKIKNRSELGKYISLVLKDAIEDFNKNHPEVENIAEKELKIVYNVGSSIANLLLKFVEG